MEKHKPTEKELKEMLTLYLKGVKPRNILKRFPEVDISAKSLSSWFSKQKARQNRDKITDKVMENLVNDIVEEQTNANKELITVSKQVIEVIKRYFEEGQYNDYTCFNFGRLVKKSSDTLNTFALQQVVKALLDAQKVQRIALGMDKEEKEKLERPIINFIKTNES